MIPDYLAEISRRGRVPPSTDEGFYRHLFQSLGTPARATRTGEGVFELVFSGLTFSCQRGSPIRDGDVKQLFFGRARL